MTAKEKLIRQVIDLGEAEAARARIVIDREPAERVSLPDGRGRMANGDPMPDVAAAVRRSRVKRISQLTDTGE
jgi:hypothetical protein